MKQAVVFTTRALFAGLLLVVPIYLAILLLLKGMKNRSPALYAIRSAVAGLGPAETAPLFSSLVICFLIGVVVRTRMGQAVREQINEPSSRIPGYALLEASRSRWRGRAARISGNRRFFKPTTASSCRSSSGSSRTAGTVFVPSIPTPLAGAVFVVERRRVHPLDVPFTDALKTVSRWGSGARDLVVAMERAEAAPEHRTGALTLPGWRRHSAIPQAASMLAGDGIAVGSGISGSASDPPPLPEARPFAGQLKQRQRLCPGPVVDPSSCASSSPPRSAPRVRAARSRRTLRPRRRLRQTPLQRNAWLDRCPRLTPARWRR